MQVLEVRVPVAGSDEVEVRLKTEPATRGLVEWNEAAEAKADHVVGAFLGRCEVRRDGEIRRYRRPGSDGWRPVGPTTRG